MVPRFIFVFGLFLLFTFASADFDKKGHGGHGGHGGNEEQGGHGHGGHEGHGHGGHQEGGKGEHGHGGKGGKGGHGHGGHEVQKGDGKEVDDRQAAIIVRLIGQALAGAAANCVKEAISKCKNAGGVSKAVSCAKNFFKQNKGRCTVG